MKRIFLNIVLALSLLSATAIEAWAVKAIPTPVSVRQPDGSVIKVMIHGDEYLNWMTSGNRIVAYGSDGYLHYASIMADGKKVLGGRVSGSGALMTNGSAPNPPAAAIKYANDIRARYTASNTPNKSISLGEKKFLILLVEFQDIPFTVKDAHQAFSDMLNKEGYSDNGGTGSVKDYFQANSLGKFKPEYVVAGPVKVSQKASYYASTDNGMSQYPKPGTPALIIEACDSLLKKGFDFAPYDLDGDGTLENIFLYYAGHNSAEGAANTIWPHSWAIYSGGKTYSGKQLGHYACSSELKGSSGTTMAGIGTFCHEFGHVLGLPDFYDTDYEKQGSGDGLENASLMSSGNYNNSGKTPPYFNFVERVLLGWKSKDDIQTLVESGIYNLNPVQTNGESFLTTTNNSGEYYLYEFRNNTGWDTPLTPGVYIYHLDSSDNMVGSLTAKQRWSSGTGINDIGMHQCFDLIKAKPFYSQVVGDNLPFGNSVKSFTGVTDPAAVAWDGSPTGYNFTNISYNNTQAQLTLQVDESAEVTGVVKDSKNALIEGAEITISIYSAPAAVKGRSQGLSMAPQMVEKLSTTSAKDGSFKIDISELDSETFEITVTKRGYMQYSNTFSITRGTIQINPVISLPQDDGDVVSKSGSMTPDNWVGLNDTSGPTIYCTQKFSVGELSKYHGYSFANISFALRSTNIKLAKALIYENETLVMEKDILSSVNLGTLTTADISDQNIVIDQSKEYRIGIVIAGYDNGYPIGINTKTMSAFGLDVSTTGTDWKSYGTSWGSMVLSFKVLNNSSFFKNLDIVTIGSTQSQWNAGDTYTYSTNMPAGAYKSIEWFFDGTSKGAAPANEVLTSGEHTVKAVIKHNNGLVETIIQVLKVQ